MDEIGGYINHIENTVDTFVPSVQKECLIFNWSKIYDIIDSVNSTFNESLIIEDTELIFTEILILIEQLTDSSQSQSSIILCNDPYVVLN